MRKLAEILDRKILFEEFDTSKNWISDFPKENWCLIIIAEEENKNYFQEIIQKSIERNVGYIFSVGKQHELIHDKADDEIIFREVDIDNHYLPKHSIMTAGNADFEYGLWEGIYITYNNEIEIDQVVILDVTRKAYSKTYELISKFELGYLPEKQ